MGLRDMFHRRRRAEWADPAEADPAEALRLAREAMDETGTHVDEHGNRRSVPGEMRESMDRRLDSAEDALRRRPPGPGAG